LEGFGSSQEWARQWYRARFLGPDWGSLGFGRRVIPSRPGMTPLTHYVIETLVTLLAIVALAVVVLVGARRAGMGRADGPLELVGRLPLDARRAVYLVRVGTTIYIVGASEAGIAKLGEVGQGTLDLPAAPSDNESFREVLSRAFGKKR